MANVLKMANIQAILSLHAAGWKQNRIAAELDLDRETVRKYLRQHLCGPKPANAPTGSDDPKPAEITGPPGCQPKPAGNAPTGSTTQIHAPESAPAPAVSPAANVPRGPASQCEPYRETIQIKLDAGLSIQRIHQDLAGEGVVVHYDALRRYVRRLNHVRPLPFRRMECQPGEEAQADFGSGASVIGADGKRRKTHVFRIVLSCSRKGYSEVTFRQTTDDFLRALENAFRSFGGVPRTLVIDNLKAAVAHPDWFDPELTPKVQAFCQHYGTVILPTRPYTPRHKGKVESGVKYVKNNALKSRKFESLSAEQAFLQHWEETIADTRIHGTTKRQVRQRFEEERSSLLPLPLEPFANFQEARRKVHRDGHVEVAKAYYSVPPEYVGRELWARWDARLVRIFNQRWEQVAIHVRSEPGRFNTHGEHVAAEKISGLERGAGYLLSQIRLIGPQSHQWAQAMLTARGIAGTRVLQGLLSLRVKHSHEALENACKTALSHGVYRLKTVRQLLKRKAETTQTPLPFLDQHPIIRPLEDYAAVVRRAIHRQDSRPSMGEGFERHGRMDDVVAAQQNSLAAPSPAPPGSMESPPSGSGYPLPGCSSAEPGSVSPTDSSVVPTSFFHQEKPHE